MVKPVPKFTVISIIILFLLPSIIVTSNATSAQNNDLVFDINLQPDYETRATAVSWPEMDLQQKFGDDFNQRAIFVHQDSSTYLDDMLYCAAIPAAIHWENNTRFESLLISDAKIRENGNLLGDYIEYLDKISATPDIDFIGDIDYDRRYELPEYFSNVDQINTVTTADNVYTGAAQIAEFYWSNQRQIGTDTAVLAYVPYANGGVEVKKDITDSRAGQFLLDLELESNEVSWLEFDINWKDPAENTDYRISIRDPYALHEMEYSNSGTTGHVNPTNNKLYQKSGYCEIGVSPYYSYMPYSIDDTPQYVDHREFSGNIVTDDVSYYPIVGANDYKQFQFGPVKSGQWIGVVTNWTHYKFNETLYRDFDTFIYGPGKDVCDEHILEAVYNPTTRLGTTPETGYCFADVDGYYTVAVHPQLLSQGGDFTTRVYWGSLDEQSTWRARQLNLGTESMEYHYKSYSVTDDDVIESVTNGAVVAALKNIPMLYTAGGSPESEVIDALERIGINNLIIIDPKNQITNEGWESNGFNIESIKSDKDVFNYIYSMAKARGLKKSLILAAQGGPWFSGAAFAGAYHGASVPALNDPELVHVQSQATTTWWQMIQLTNVYDNYPLNKYQAPGQFNMEDLADDFYSWLEKLNPEFNPDCGDANGDGKPDNGKYWDYSDDIEVLVISPLNALKPSLDRAINGKASVGRIQIAKPPVLWAILSREMLYWKLGFSRADNPENPNDSLPIKDHWKRVGWTFNTYAHDDDIMDYDAGDQDDDDYCGVDDGGANHLAYKPRETWPEVATNYGKNNEFHTYYQNIRDMLEGGICYWSNNGHGHSYWMTETGLGYTGTSTDSSDPPWAGPNPPDNCFIDPPLETTTGWDWFYDMNNIHSTFSTYQSCQVGGTALPEYFLRLGGIAVIGGVVSRALIEATIQSDRTTKGLFSGMTFGDAHRWGMDEVGCMYSLDDPGDTNQRNSSTSYDDDFKFRNGDTGQTILYGDPSLVMIAPTLFVNTYWKFPEVGKNITIWIIIQDQDGNMANPDSLNVKINSNSVEYSKQYNGGYMISWFTSNPGKHFLEVSITKEGFVSSNGENSITKDYTVYIPEFNLTADNLTYSGGMKQTIGLDVFGSLPNPFYSNLNDINTNYIQLKIYNYDNSSTEFFSNLSYYDSGYWKVTEMDASKIPVGKYQVFVYASVKYWPDKEIYVGDITINHVLNFTKPRVSFTHTFKTLDLKGLQVTSSYSPNGILSPEKLEIYSYELFHLNGFIDAQSTDIRGNLSYNYSIKEFLIENLSLLYFSMGEYFVRITLEAPYTNIYYIDSGSFNIYRTLSIDKPDLIYQGGLTQQIYISNIQVKLAYSLNQTVPIDEISENKYSILAYNSTFEHITENLSYDKEAEMWYAKVNVTNLIEGTYFVRLFFNCTGYGNITQTSYYFNVEHVYNSSNPEFKYNNKEFKLRFYNISLWTSINGTGILDNNSGLKTSYEINSRSYFYSQGMTGELLFKNNNWELELNVSTLKGGEYYIVCLFEFENRILWLHSPSFTVKHRLILPKPKMVFDQDNDTLYIYVIKPYSTYPNYNFLDLDSVTESEFRLIDMDGKTIYFDQLNYIYRNRTFYGLISKVSKTIAEGTYYTKVIFNASNHNQVNNTSLPINLTFKKPHDNTKGMGAWDYGFIISILITIIILIIISILIYFEFLSRSIKNQKQEIQQQQKPDNSQFKKVKRKSKQEDEEIKYF